MLLLLLWLHNIWDLSSWTRDQTHAPSSESTESQSVEVPSTVSQISHQGHKRKEEINRSFSKLKFFPSKDTIKKLKRQLTEWEKIFANHISDQGLVSRIYIYMYIKLLQQQRDKQLKMGKLSEETFLQRYTNS